MKTQAIAIPTTAGTPFADGIYIARYFEGTEARALIVAPRKEGDLKSDSHAHAIELAQACAIGEHKDWHLPTRLQALLLWNNRKALKKADAFQEAWYWTSEIHERDADCAWLQSFYSGGQTNSLRFYDVCRARFVRSVVI